MVSADALAVVPLLQSLSDRDRKRLAKVLKERRLDAGQDIVSEGEGGIAFFVLLEGEAEVIVGGERRRTLQPGDFFGEIALLAPDALRTATVRTTAPCVLTWLSHWDFKPFVLEHPETAWTMLQALAARLARHEEPVVA